MELVILVGNIGCGKSTKALELANNGYCVINDDAVVTMIGGGKYTLYDVKKKPIYKNIEAVGAITSLNYGFNTVIDMPNMTKRKRKRYIDIGKGYTCKIICYNWGPGISNDLQRRLKDHRGYTKWVEAFKRKHSEYEEPTLDEGFDELINMR